MTTKHSIQKNEDGTHTYRGHRISRRDDKRYFVGWMRSIETAPTLKAMAANIDAYIAAEEKAWKPVLRQDGTYCSPRCGFKCTKAAHDEAQRNAKLLVTALGPGWKPRVWENGGWHFEVVIDSAEVDCRVMPPTRNREQYICYLNTSQQFIAKADTPHEAVAESLRLLDEHVANLTRAATVVRNPAA